MLFRSNECAELSAAGRMLRCAADRACAFVANFPAVSWLYVRHSVVENHHTEYWLETGALKACCAQNSSGKQDFCIAYKARIHFMVGVRTRESEYL